MRWSIVLGEIYQADHITVIYTYMGDGVYLDEFPHTENLIAPLEFFSDIVTRVASARFRSAVSRGHFCVQSCIQHTEMKACTHIVFVPLRDYAH